MQKTSHAMIDLNQNSRSLSKKDASFDSSAALVLDLDHKDRVHSGQEATKKSVPPFFNLNQISVEIDGQVYGKGIRLTWDEAKMHAVKRALRSLRTMQGPNIHRRQSSPRPFQGLSNKHVCQQEHLRTLQRFASSGRYPRLHQFHDKSNKIFNLTYCFPIL
ncbi:RNA polymerase II C-terminal domain phosphatase [Trifolium repens]|nr:RNA polymerase II C-terminal domain phosphatase [Trifolium repens]